MQLSDLRVNLTLDNDGFKLSVRDSDRLLRQFEQRLGDTARSVKNVESHFTSLGAKAHQFVMTLGMARFAVMDLNDIFLSLPKAIIASSAEIERMTTLMKGLSSESDKMADAMKGRKFVFDMAMNAPFDFKALTDTFVKLKTGGIDPANGSMQALTDSVAKFGGNSEALHRASIAIQQMGGKGVISMEELRQQLGEAVPNAMQLMAVGAGMTMADLTKAVSKGTVESQSALQRMFAVMAEVNRGASEDMMNTWTGLFSQLQTKWELFKYEMGGGDSSEGMFSGAKQGLKELVDSFGGGTMRQIGADVSYLMNEGVKAISALVHGMGQYYDSIKTAGELMLTYFVSSKFVEAMGAIGLSLQKVWQGGEAALAAYRKSEQERFVQFRSNAQAEIVLLEQKLAAQLAADAELQARKDALFQQQMAANQALRQASREKEIFEIRAAQRQVEFIQQEIVALEALRVAKMQDVAATQAQITQQEKMIATQAAQTAAVVETTTAMGLWKATMGGLGTIFTALGGWVTVAITAITALAYAWESAASAADKAADAARRAVQGFSTKEDIDKIDNQIQRLRSKQAPMTAEGTNEVFAGRKKEYDAIEAQIEELKTRRNMAEDNIRRAAVKDRVDATTRIAKEQAEGNAKAWSLAIDYEMAEYNRKAQSLAETIKDPKKLAEAQRQLAVENGENIRKYSGQRSRLMLGAFNSTIATLREQGKSATGEAKQVIDETIASLNELVAKENQRLPAQEKIGTSTTVLPGKDKKDKKEPKNPLDAMLRQEQAEVAEIGKHMENLRNSVDGIESVQAEVQAKMSKMLSGDALVRGDRDFRKDAGFAAKKKELEEAITANIVGRKALQEYQKLTQESASLKEKAAASDAALENDGVKSGENVTRVSSMLAKIQESMKIAGGQNAIDEYFAKAGTSFNKFADDLQSNAARIDLNNLVRPQIEEAKKIRAQLEGVADERGGREAEYQRLVTLKEKEFALLLKEAQTRGVVQSQIEASQKAHDDYMKALADKHVEDMKTPMDKLVDQWKDTTRQMEAAGAKWGSDFVDMTVDALSTGKIEFNKFVTSVLSSILKIQVQQMMGEGINGVIKQGTSWVNKTLFGKGGEEAAAAGTKALGEAAKNAADGLKETAGSAVQSALKGAAETGVTVRNTSAMATFAMTLDGAVISLQNFIAALAAGGGSSGGSSLGGLGGAIAGMFGGGGGGAAAGMTGAGTMAELGSMGIFANGGIMTRYGEAQLRKYAAGGIADSPQLALFGEGSMNEAYVPLPDGRSIPVTMKGGQGGNNVTISIVVNKDGSATTSASEDVSGYREMAERVRNIVQEQLAKETRPGGVLYR